MKFKIILGILFFDIHEEEDDDDDFIEIDLTDISSDDLERIAESLEEVISGGGVFGDLNIDIGDLDPEILRDVVNGDVEVRTIQIVLDDEELLLDEDVEFDFENVVVLTDGEEEAGMDEMLQNAKEILLEKARKKLGEKGKGTKTKLPSGTTKTAAQPKVSKNPPSSVPKQHKVTGTPNVATSVKTGSKTHTKVTVTPSTAVPTKAGGKAEVKIHEKVISSSTSKGEDLERFMLKSSSESFVLNNFVIKSKSKKSNKNIYPIEKLLEELAMEDDEDSDPSFNFVEAVNSEEETPLEESADPDLELLDSPLELAPKEATTSVSEKGDVMGRVKEVMNTRAKKMKKVLRIEEIYSRIQAGEMDVQQGVDYLTRYSSVTPLADYYLGELYLSTKNGLFNFTLAKRHFFNAAWAGNARAMFKIGSFFSNNLIDEADVSLWNDLSNSSYQYDAMNAQQTNQALSLLFLFMASMAGSERAGVTLAYRHYYGLGVPMKCQAAANYFMIGTRNANINEVFPMSYGEKFLLSDESSFGKKDNEDNVMDYLVYSADRGDPQAQVAVGYANMMGMRGREQNGELAREQFERAIEGGNPEAFAPLATMYANGMAGTDQNNDTALELFERGAEYDDPKSHNGLGFMFMNGAGVERNLTRAFFHFNKSAHLGNAEGQYNLATLYFLGEGVKKDHKQALHWTKVASMNGQTFALRRLGEMYMKGFGTHKSCATSIMFFKKFTDALYWQRLGDAAFSAFSDGDYTAAFLEFMHLAEFGEVFSQLNLAWLYENGYGDELYAQLGHFNETTAINETRRNAMRVYKRAAQQGAWDAHVKVGDAYFYGSGLAFPNYTKSAYHYRLAANKNNAQACFNLGYMHEFGLGVPKDYFLAKRNYQLASQYDKYGYLAVGLATTKLIIKWGIEKAFRYLDLEEYIPWIADGVMITHPKDFDMEEEEEGEGVPIEDDDDAFEELWFDSLLDWLFNSDLMLLVLAAVFVVVAVIRNRMIREDEPEPRGNGREQPQGAVRNENREGREHEE